MSRRWPTLRQVSDPPPFISRVLLWIIGWGIVLGAMTRL